MIVAGDAGSAPRSLPGTTVILASDNPKAPTAPAPPDHRPNAFPELMGTLHVNKMISRKMSAVVNMATMHCCPATPVECTV